jgi:hypothetical protein
MYLTKQIACHTTLTGFFRYDSISLLANGLVVVVALLDNIIFRPNVLPLSSLSLITGSLLLWVLSHQLTYALLPDAAISALS